MVAAGKHTGLLLAAPTRATTFCDGEAMAVRVSSFILGGLAAQYDAI